MDNETPSYYAIIPAEVRYSNIPANAKLLYGEITALCNKNGICFASNDYFAKLYRVEKRTITRWIKDLIDNKFITAEYTYKKGSKEIENRCIKLASGGIVKNVMGYSQKCLGGIDKNVLDNNTSINNTSINNIKLHSPHSKEYAEQLSEIVKKQKNIKIDTRKISAWSKSIDLLIHIDGVDEERIKKALAWYSINVGGDYVPVIESGTTFREKFGKLEAAIKRAEFNKKSSLFDDEPKTEHDWSWV